jgi:hypothetical protein
MMNKVVPHEINYKTINKISSSSSFLLLISALISLSILIFEKTNLLESKEILNRNLNAALGILAILYFLLDIVQNYLFQQAELNRKNDFIDNSLKTKLSEENSQGYFSNDNFTPSIYKLGVNGFENSFFTKSISSKMIVFNIIKSAIILILFLFVIFYTDQSTLISLVQIALPFTIIQQTIRLIIFNFYIKRVFDNYKHIFSNVAKAQRSALIIDNVINYEKTISWGGIQLDSKLFNKHNPKLTLDWETLKTKYNI